MPIEIRPATAADEPIITQIRRETWLAAYAQIIDPEIIERVTAPRDDASAGPPPDRTSLVAVAAPTGASAVAYAPARADAPAVIGYASFGPERTVASAFTPFEASPTAPRLATAGVPPQAATEPARYTPAGLARDTGELYALYVAPAHWSTGAGRVLTDGVVDRLRAAGYRRVVLWTLTGNARARRFYEKAGFTPDGATNVLAALGHVEEVRYVRDL